mmetsp:Transcript_37686/g.94604  ORF Transcript_37686/g.94604 Transcript_37686/m.94604 type:complete len:171 (+) Transcript_37686:94-606(+)
MAAVVQATAVDPNATYEGQRVVQASSVSAAPAPVVMGQVVQGHVVGTPVGVTGYAPHSAYGGGPMAGGPSPMVVGGMGGFDVAGMHGQHMEPADEPLCAALIACLCCCWCLGLFAICKAQEVSKANAMGDYPLAHQKRKEAMTWIYATVAVGLIFYIINTALRLSMGEGQ